MLILRAAAAIARFPSKYAMASWSRRICACRTSNLSNSSFVITLIGTPAFPGELVPAKSFWHQARALGFVCLGSITQVPFLVCTRSRLYGRLDRRRRSASACMHAETMGSQAGLGGGAIEAVVQPPEQIIRHRVIHLFTFSPNRIWRMCWLLFQT